MKINVRMSLSREISGQSGLTALLKHTPAGLCRACHGFAWPARLPSAASPAGGSAARSAVPPLCPPPAGDQPLHLTIIAPPRSGITIRPTAGRYPAASYVGLLPCPTAGHMAVVAALLVPSPASS
jgi:hypothetical protein